MCVEPQGGRRADTVPKIGPQMPLHLDSAARNQLLLLRAGAFIVPALSARNQPVASCADKRLTGPLRWESRQSMASLLA